MKFRVTKAASKHDILDRIQYVVEVKAGLFGFWRYIDSTYARSDEEGLKQAKELLSKHREAKVIYKRDL